MNAARRRGLLGPAAATLAALAVLIGLGVWQLERRAWKQNLIDAVGRKLAAMPADLPPGVDRARLDRAEWEFRQVRFVGELRNDQEALVYTSGSTLRVDVGGPGYWVFAPAQTRSTEGSEARAPETAAPVRNEPEAYSTPARRTISRRARREPRKT